jgi:tetratricopeptide (TPR) repeat protein
MSALVRLSQSGLWERQRQYYHEKGVQAWNTGTVPHYITNNPVIANAYADLIAAHIDDLARHKALDLKKPVHVVEMGGGSGRLAFLIMRRLEALKDVLPVKVRYVLTDFTTTNLGHWREHPSFAPYFAGGKLDLARFDVENDSVLELEMSGDKLDGTGNPVFFVANYLFDTLTQDCFRINDGVLEEALPKITYAEDTTTVDYTYVAATEAPYGRSEYDEILRQYQQKLGDTSFLFPVGPLKCLEALMRIGGDRVCLITADKSWSRWEDLVGLGDPSLVAHGPSFSMTVNFHAMGMYWEGKGGHVLHTSPRDSMLQISCFCLGPPAKALARTRRAFEDRLDGFGPLDFFNLKSAISEVVESKSLRLGLELMRMSCWDPEILFELADGLATRLDDIPTLHKRELFLALTRSWQNYFPIGESKDVPFEIARILFRMEFFEQSLHFYEESLRLFGKHKMTFHNMGLCYYYMRRLSQAREAFESALELEPGYGVAREWLVRLAPEIEESGTFPALAG